VGVSGRPRLRAYLAFAVAGFRRHSTYRQATVAACVTNSVFGFLRAAVMLAVLAAGGSVIAGYDAPKLMTFVWVGQGLIGTVLIWAPPELAGRIRTGDVVIDPFMGAGSVGIAAGRLGRRFLGNDLNPEAVKIASQRLREFGEGRVPAEVATALVEQPDLLDSLAPRT